MKFEFTKVYNFEGSFRGLRNPLESWHKSDSFFGIINIEFPQDEFIEVIDKWAKQNLDKHSIPYVLYDDTWEKCWEIYSSWLWENSVLAYDYELYVVAMLGPNDLDLAQRLILAGPEHCKFMRQVFVSVDITASLYWWKEFDTYKVGTTANSTSTMHKLTSVPITKEMFEFDNLNLTIDKYTVTHGGECETIFEDYIDDIVDMCENLRKKYIETKDKRYWRALVQMLPEGWLQTRTITMSYANLHNIYFQRRDHKLKEWHQFCDWIKSLPYAEELIMLEAKENEIN